MLIEAKQYYPSDDLPECPAGEWDSGSEEAVARPISRVARRDVPWDAVRRFTINLHLTVNCRFQGNIYSYGCGYLHATGPQSGGFDAGGGCTLARDRAAFPGRPH